MKGHLRKRGNSSWTIVIDLGRDATGKRKQKWQAVQGTRKQAETELTTLLNSINTGSYVASARITVSEYLDRWLKDYAKVNVAAKTYERYEEIARLHLKPDLGHHQLTKLQPLHIQASYSHAMESGRKDGREGGLSPQTVVHHHRVLREALKQAVKWQLLARNPVDAVEPPRPKRKEMKVINEKDTATLLDVAKATAIYMPVVLAVGTGLRRGEALAVRWKDIDLGAGLLSVQQSLEQTKQGLAFKSPKTAKGRRLVTLPRFAIDALKRHKVEQAKLRLSQGPAYEDRDLVCARSDGKPMDPRSVSHMFGVFIKGVGLPRVRLHDLRHTHATHLLNQGIHPKVVSERLGHSTVSITLDTYSHVMPSIQEEAARKLDAVIRKAGKAK